MMCVCDCSLSLVCVAHDCYTQLLNCERNEGEAIACLCLAVVVLVWWTSHAQKKKITHSSKCWHAFHAQWHHNAALKSSAGEDKRVCAMVFGAWVCGIVCIVCAVALLVCFCLLCCVVSAAVGLCLSASHD